MRTSVRTCRCARFPEPSSSAARSGANADNPSIMAAAAEQEAQPVPESRWVGTTKEKGEQMLERAMKRNPMVKFMLEKLEEVGEDVPPTQLICRPREGCGVPSLGV